MSLRTLPSSDIRSSAAVIIWYRTVVRVEGINHPLSDNLITRFIKLFPQAHFLPIAAAQNLARTCTPPVDLLLPKFPLSLPFTKKFIPYRHISHPFSILPPQLSEQNLPILIQQPPKLAKYPHYSPVNPNFLGEYLPFSPFPPN